MIGTSVGPYKIIEQLGAGGMGEVYLAEDSRLGRTVAIKVLPAEFADDRERLARFEQEARAAAALNHPHIAAVFDVGTEGETHFMVQEYLKGQSLRETLEKGALALKKVLALAIEISEALAAAHEAGIVHRDLKPENIFVMKDGHAKVLDFGLAKLTEISATPSIDPSESPTKLGTMAGQVMGTAGYMAPEQALGGQEIDHRADVFAFGCVLYEMLCGKRAFTGETVLDTLHAISRSEPEPLGAIRPDAPAELQRIVAKCLAKDRSRRYQHADDLMVDMRVLASDVEAGTAPTIGESTDRPDRAKSGIPWTMSAAVAVAAAALAVLLVLTMTPTAELPVSRAVIQLDESQRLDASGQIPFAVSPDGKLLVYAVVVDGRQQLYLREMNRFEAAPIPGTEGASGPFFSPDGQWIGFFTPGRLKKVSITGGDPQVISEFEQPPRGATWGPDDTIVVGVAGSEGLMRVSAASESAAVVLLAPGAGAVSLERPRFLPDGRSLIYTAEAQESVEIRVLSLDTGESKSLAPGMAARYTSSGHLVYAEASGNMLAVPFDPERQETRGSPTVLLEPVRMYETGAAFFDVSGTGSLVYVPAAGSVSSLVWVNRDGSTSPASQHLTQYSAPRISPDGSKIAVVVGSATTDTQIWLLEVGRDFLSPLTSRGSNTWPSWSPDGEWVGFASARDNSLAWDIFRKPVGAEPRDPAEALLTRAGFQTGLDVSPDGASALFVDRGPQGDIGAFSLAGDADPELIVATEASESNPKFSPDGHWVAYQSDNTGRFEVYVRPFSGPGARARVSSSGGTSPVWSRNGRELYYRRGFQVLAVEVETEPEFKVLSEQTLFEIADVVAITVASYDVGPDGRFIMVLEEQATRRDSLNLVTNWFEELKQLVPVER